LSPDSIHISFLTIHLHLIYNYSMFRLIIVNWHFTSSVTCIIPFGIQIKMIMGVISIFINLNADVGFAAHIILLLFSSSLLALDTFSMTSIHQLFHFSTASVSIRKLIISLNCETFKKQSAILSTSTFKKESLRELTVQNVYGPDPKRHER
jgi:hypothetical protein